MQINSKYYSKATLVFATPRQLFYAGTAQHHHHHLSNDLEQAKHSVFGTYRTSKFKYLTCFRPDIVTILKEFTYPKTCQLYVSKQLRWEYSNFLSFNSVCVAMGNSETFFNRIAYLKSIKQNKQPVNSKYILAVPSLLIVSLNLHNQQFIYT